MGKKEIVLALVGGKRFKNPSGDIIYFDEFYQDKPFRIIFGELNEPLEGMWEYLEEFIEIKEWYEDIPPQGILCWVWGECQKNKRPCIITTYNPQRDKPFGDNFGLCWQNARFLTNEEVEYLIVNE